MMKSVLMVLISATVLTASASAGDMWFGVYGGPRFNSAGGTAIDALKEGGGKVTAASQFGAGAYVTLPLSTQVKLNLGAGYTQRGYGMESETIQEDVSVQAVDMSSKVAMNYLDINLGIAWYFLAAEKDPMNIQPYLGADLIPGFFMSGKSTSTYFGNESSEDISKDDVKTINFALRPNAGLDFMISPDMLIGVNLGYELGLTNIAKPMYEGATDTPTVKLNGVTTAVRIAFAL